MERAQIVFFTPTALVVCLAWLPSAEKVVAAAAVAWLRLFESVVAVATHFPSCFEIASVEWGAIRSLSIPLPDCLRHIEIPQQRADRSLSEVGKESAPVSRKGGKSEFVSGMRGEIRRRNIPTQANKHKHTHTQKWKQVSSE